MPGFPGAQQAFVAPSLGSKNQPPRHISAQHWQELVVGSAIDPEIAALNFRSFGPGFADAAREREILLHEAKAQENQPGHAFARLIKLDAQYAHILQGGWRFCGDALPGFDATPRWKPDHPRASSDGRPIKYEARPKAEQGLLLPQYSERAWRLVAERYGLPMPADLSGGFWQWALDTPEVKLTPAEGEKKACCLAGLGFAAIGLPGIWMGRRVPEKDGVKRRDLARLVPELKALAVEGRSFCIAFDRDAKPSTANDVDHAAVTLGHLLEASGCNVGIARIPERWWADKTGVDDLVADGMAADLIAALDAPLTLAEMAWHFRYRTDRQKPIHLQLATRKLAEETELQQKLRAPLIAVRSAKASGKTELMARWLKDQPEVVAITHRRSLGTSLANRLHLRWRNDLDCGAGRVFNEGTGEVWEGLPPRLALCADSLHRLGDPAKYANAIVVIDEASQVIAHLLTSTTKNCRELRGVLIQQLEGLVRHCKQVILLDADLGDAEVKWVEQAKGSEAVLINNTAKPSPWPVTWWEHPGPEAIQKALITAVKAGERPLVVTDSREGATAINQLLEAETGLTGALITRDTVDCPEVQSLLPRLNCADAVTPLHWLVASPSISSGVSIEHDAFTSVFGLFFGGSLDDAEILQALARVRPCVPRHVWVKPHTRAAHPVSSAWWPEQVKEDLLRRWTTEARLMRLHLTPAMAGKAPLEMAESFDAVVHLWAAFTARRNYSHAHLRPFVLARLRDEGHSIARYTAPLKEAEQAAMKQLKKSLKDARNDAETAAIAGARSIGQKEAEALQQKSFRTPAEQASLQKRIICQRMALPPEDLTPEMVAWSNEWGSAARRLLMVLEPTVALATDYEQLLASEGGMLPWDQGLRLERSGWAEGIGLTSFIHQFCCHDGPGWDGNTPEVQALAKKARIEWRAVSSAFGVAIKPWPTDEDQTPLSDHAAREAEKDLDAYAVKLLGTLLRHLGIVTVASRKGSGQRRYQPEQGHLQNILKTVDRLRRNAFALLHTPPVVLKERQGMEHRLSHLPKPASGTASIPRSLAHKTPVPSSGMAPHLTNPAATSPVVPCGSVGAGGGGELGGGDPC